jgi:iron complex outermembrane recepter protein
MSFNIARLRTCASSAALIIGLLTAPAMAQESVKNDPPDEGEILVTANKREQSLNDVGLTVQTASGDDLADRGIASPADLGKLIPGFTFTQSLYSTPVYTLRGIGLYDATFGAAPSVSVYSDQVPRNFPVMSDALDLDIARVEVLKGPQGTLFGQSSTGGAINYIAAKPTEHFEAGMNASYERFDRIEASGFVSGALGDGVKARLAVKGVTGGAWQRSLSRPDDDNGDARKLSGRLTVDIEPSDTIKIELMATGAIDKSDPLAPQYAGTIFNIYSTASLAAANANPATRNPFGVANDARYAALTNPISAGYDASFLGRQATLVRRMNTGAGSTAAGALAILGTPVASGNARSAEWTPGLLGKSDNDYYQLSGRMDWEVADGITITSLTALARQTLDYAQDLDATTAVAVDVPLSGKVSTFNQELRVAGDSDRLNWIIGASYDNLRSTQSNFFGLQDYSANDPFFDATGGVFSLPIQVTKNDFASRLKTYSLFANAEFKLTDALTFNGGIRYTNNKQQASYCYNDPASDTAQNASSLFYAFEGAFGNPGLPPINPGECFVLGDGLQGTTFGRAIRTPLIRTLKEDNVSFRAGLNYKLDAGGLLYATVSQGYKTGIFSAIGASSTSQYSAAPQEKVLAYEGGVKLPFGGRFGNFNSAVFYYDYSDKQVRGRIADPVFGLLEKMLNVPKSYVFGIEGELTLRPVDGLRLGASATYLKTKVTSDYSTTPDGLNIYNAAGYTGNFKNSTLPYTPKFSANADVEYEFDISASSKAFLGGTLLYQGSQNTTFHNSALPADDFHIDGYATVDLRAGVTSADGAWKATVFGRNVFNKNYTTAVSTYLDTLLRYKGRPAVFGISLQYNFGN